MNHPDFRVMGKIFATLGAPNAEWGMVKLSPEEQQNYLDAAPDAFQPAAGAWGLQGATLVRLSAARTPLVRKALTTAATAVRERTARPTAGRKSAKK